MMRQILHHISTSKINSNKTSHSETKKSYYTECSCDQVECSHFPAIFVKSSFQTHPLIYNLSSTCSASQIMPPATPVQHFSPSEELSLSRIHGQSGNSSPANMKEELHHPSQVKTHFYSTLDCKYHKVCIFHSGLVTKH